MSSTIDFNGVALQAKSEPLKRSHEADLIESELKALLLESMDLLLGEKVFNANVMGAPYLGDLESVRAASVNEGLSVVRSFSGEATNHYLLKAWLGMNSQHRGYDFLKTYLQLQFPNANKVTPLWHDSDTSAYPESVKKSQQESTDWLTSRVLIDIYAAPEFTEIKPIEDSIIAIMPARFVPVIKAHYPDINLEAPRPISVGIFFTMTQKLTPQQTVSTVATVGGANFGTSWQKTSPQINASLIGSHDGQVAGILDKA